MRKLTLQRSLARSCWNSVVLLAVVILLCPMWAAAQTLPRPDHIVIVIEENHDYGQIVGESEAKYINSLVAEGAVLTKFYALRHPSQPNYFILFSGDHQDVVNDECAPNSPPVTNPSLGGQLIQNGHTFIGYAEGLPSVGSKTCKAGKYRRKHAPWVSFADVPAEASRPFSDFPTDFEKLPTISFVIPNMVNDMHDGLFGTRRKRGDKWLRDKLDNYKKWAMTHNSLLIVTWDEDDNVLWHTGDTTKPPKNHIATILVGEMIKPGSRSDTQYTHLDLLRTLQEMYGLPALPGTQNATVISDIWK